MTVLKRHKDNLQIFRAPVCGRHGRRRIPRIPCLTGLAVFLMLALLTGCGKGPAPGQVYGPSDSEENLYLDGQSEENTKTEDEEENLLSVEIDETGYTVTQIDESNVYPPKKTDDYGNALPAYLVDYAVKISNEDSDTALIWPVVTVSAYGSDGRMISSAKKRINTYVLPGDEIFFGADMTVRGEEPQRIEFTAQSTNPEDFYPTEEELKMPSSDKYKAGEVSADVLEEYEKDAPAAGRKNSQGLSEGYYYFRELPMLSGTVSCASDTDEEAFVTIVYRSEDGEILGGETGRVMIPAGKEASYVLTAAGPVPKDTKTFEVNAFSIAEY